jgi:hypothetical protein
MSDLRKSKKSRRAGEEEQKSNNGITTYFGITSGLFDSKVDTDNIPSSIEFAERSRQSKLSQKLEQIRGMSSTKKSAKKTKPDSTLNQLKIFTPQLKKLIKSRNLKAGGSKNFDSGKKRKLKKILAKMSSTKNLASQKEEDVAHNDEEEDALEQILRKYKSIEARMSKDNSEQ